MGVNRGGFVELEQILRVEPIFGIRSLLFAPIVRILNGKIPRKQRGSVMKVRTMLICPKRK